jgi:hypothetical protein
MMKHHRAIAVVAAILLQGCSGGDGPTAPQPPSLVAGVLTITITGTRADDGALLVRAEGLSSPETLQLLQAQLTMHARPRDTGTTVAFFGRANPGPLASFPIADIARASAYRISIVEVANARGELRPDSAVATYSVAVAPR